MFAVHTDQNSTYFQKTASALLLPSYPSCAPRAAWGKLAAGSSTPNQTQAIRTERQQHAVATAAHQIAHAVEGQSTVADVLARPQPAWQPKVERPWLVSVRMAVLFPVAPRLGIAERLLSNSRGVGIDSMVFSVIREGSQRQRTSWAPTSQRHIKAGLL